MFRSYSIVLLTGLTLLVTVCGAIPADFEPYQVIVDREIFGKRVAPPQGVPPVDPQAIDQKLAEKLAQRLVMCAVNRTPSGNMAVGFIDNDAKPPRNIYLNVGETTDGYSILAADYDAETATIEKDGVTVTLQLGKGLVAAAPTGRPVPLPGRSDQGVLQTTPRPGGTGWRRDPGVPRPVPPGLMRATASSPSPADMESYRERRQERETQELARVEQEREVEDQEAREKYVVLQTLTREIVANELLKQALAERGLEIDDPQLDEDDEIDAVAIGEL